MLRREKKMQERWLASTKNEDNNNEQSSTKSLIGVEFPQISVLRRKFSSSSSTSNKKKTNTDSNSSTSIEVSKLFQVGNRSTRVLCYLSIRISCWKEQSILLLNKLFSIKPWKDKDKNSFLRLRIELMLIE